MTPSFQNESSRTPAHSRLAIESVDLPHGVRVPYAVHGSTDGVPVVMLHGLSDSLRSFERLLPSLPASMRVFIPTLRSHGDAGRPESGHRPADFADDVTAFMDVMGIESAVIVGHSMGSQIAQRFAIDNPDRVLGLVLLGAFRTVRELSGIDEIHAAIDSLEDPVDPDFVREFQLSTITQPVPAAFIDSIIADSLKLSAATWQAIIDGFLDDETFQQISTISAPTLLIWGDQDSVTPRAEQDVMVSTIPDARLITYHGTGHAVHWEQPERVASDLIGFVDGLTPSA